jgi:hypothetical protein
MYQTIRLLWDNSVKKPITLLKTAHYLDQRYQLPDLFTLVIFLTSDKSENSCEGGTLSKQFAEESLRWADARVATLSSAVMQKKAPSWIPSWKTSPIAAAARRIVFPIGFVLFALTASLFQDGVLDKETYWIKKALSSSAEETAQGGARAPNSAPNAEGNALNETPAPYTKPAPLFSETADHDLLAKEKAAPWESKSVSFEFIEKNSSGDSSSDALSASKEQISAAHNISVSIGNSARDYLEKAPSAGISEGAFSSEASSGNAFKWDKIEWGSLPQTALDFSNGNEDRDSAFLLHSEETPLRWQASIRRYLSDMQGK